MSTPWEVQNREFTSRWGLATVEVGQFVRGMEEYDEEVHGPAGLEPFWVIDVTIDDLGDGDVVTNRNFGFSNGWNKVTLPSLRGLLKDPSHVNDKYVEWQWATVKEWDSRTRQQEERLAIKFIKVFPNEEAAITAMANAAAAAGNNSTGNVIDDDDDENDAGMASVILRSLTQACLTKSGKLQRKKLEGLISANPVVLSAYPIEEEATWSYILDLTTEIMDEDIPF